MSEVGQDITEEQSQLRKQLRLLHEKVQSDVYDRKHYLIGKVLTITDSITNDPDQRKAVKDLVQNSFYGGSYPGSYDSITWQFMEFANAHGFDLYDKDKAEAPSMPSNQYLDIK